MIKTACVNGVEMDYAVLGRGKKPFVMIPGLSLKSTVANAEAVEAAYASFLDEYTLYLLDPRKNMPADYSLIRFADDTYQVLDSLNVKAAALFGTSMGGMVSQLLALRHPDMVSCLMLSSTMARVTPTSDAVFTRWRELALQGKTDELTGDMVDHVFSEKLLRKFRKALIRLNAGAGEKDMRRIAVLTEAMLHFDCLQELPRLACPVLVIGSEGDRVVGPEGVREIAEKLPCTFYIYPGDTGHAVYDEETDFKDRLQAFLHA